MTTSKKTATKKPTSRKGRTKTASKRVPHYTPEQRGAALALLDFNGGNIKRTAAQLQMSRQTLSDWNAGRGVDEAAKVSHVRHRLDIVGLVEETLSEYLAAARQKVRERKTSFFHINGGIGILVDKRNVMLGRPVQISASLTGPSTQPSAPNSEVEAYERILLGVISDAAAEGKVITREQAAEMIIELKPEAKEFLALSGGQVS